MSFILKHKTQIATFVSAVVLSVLLVALQVFGASLVDTDSVAVGTTTVGAGLYVNEGFSSVLSGDAYIYGQLNLPFLVATTTTASSLGGSLGVGTTTPGGTTFGVNEGWSTVLSGEAYVYGQLNVPFIVSTSTTASTFAGQITTSGTAGVGVGTATPGASQLGVNEGWTSVLSGDAYVYGQLNVPFIVSTSTTASTFAGQITTSGTAGVGVGTATPGASQFGVNEGWTSVLSGDAYIYGPLNMFNFVATSTTATSTTSFGLTIASSSLNIDGMSGRVAIGTSTFADGTVANTQAVDPALTISGAGEAAGATGTLYISGGGANGGQLIIKATDGGLCVSIMAQTGANDVDASAQSATTLLTTKVVACPE